jgi:hypothetical protein
VHARSHHIFSPDAALNKTKGAVHISRYREASTTDRAPVAATFLEL